MTTQSCTIQPDAGCIQVQLWVDASSCKASYRLQRINAVTEGKAAARSCLHEGLVLLDGLVLQAAECAGFVCV